MELAELQELYMEYRERFFYRLPKYQLVLGTQDPFDPADTGRAVFAADSPKSWTNLPARTLTVVHTASNGFESSPTAGSGSMRPRPARHGD